MSVLQALIEQRRMDQQGVQNLINTLHDLATRIRMRKLTDAFYKQGDFSPEGIKRFAEQNKLSLPEMYQITKAVAAFNQYRDQRDPWVTVTEVQPDDTKVTRMVRRSQLPAGGVVTGRPRPEDVLKRQLFEGERKLGDLTPEQKAALGIKETPMVNVPGVGNVPANVGYHYLSKPVKPIYKVYVNSKTGQRQVVDLSREEPPTGPDWVLESKYTGPKSTARLNENINKLKLAISLLKERLPTDNIFTDITAEDLLKSENQQNYIQMLEKAMKSKDPVIRKTAKKALEAYGNIFGPIEYPQPKKPVRAKKNRVTGQIVVEYDDGTVEAYTPPGQSVALPIPQR